MTNNKQKTRKQHYVPQTYLRSFSIPNKKSKDVQLNIFNKIEKKFYISSIEDAMEKNYFYDINIKDLLLELSNNKSLIDKVEINKWDEQLIEHSLNSVEDELKKVIEIIKDADKHNYFKWSKNFNRIQLCQLIAIQFIRTPKGKDFIVDIEKTLMENEKQTQIKYSKNIKNMILLKELINILEVFNIKNIKNIENDKEFEEYVNKYHSIYLEYFLKFNKVEIGINQSDIPLITSDNPIICNVNKDFVYYPITPEYCIFLKKVTMPTSLEITRDELKKHLNNFENFLPNPDIVLRKINEKFKKIHEEKTKLHHNLTKEEVFRYNFMMYSNAERFIASNIKLEEMINEINKQIKYLNKNIR